MSVSFRALVTASATLTNKFFVYIFNRDKKTLTPYRQPATIQKQQKHTKSTRKTIKTHRKQHQQPPTLTRHPIKT